MSNNIANYFSPAATTNAATVKPNATSGSSSSTSDPSGLNSVFLNLLTQELQNQDPTAPMDSTAMVGQMISLNQLNELYSINSTLTNATGASSSTNARVSSQSATQAANAALAAMASPAAGAMTSSFPSFTPATQNTTTNPYSYAPQAHTASTMALSLR